MQQQCISATDSVTMAPTRRVHCRCVRCRKGGGNVLFGNVLDNFQLMALFEHLAAHANMWRMTGDFWDEWSKLHAMFERCYAWQEYVQPGAWPDCDMLPLGRIQLTEKLPEYRNRYTRFTHDEQITMMTLWGIFRSPLMMGGEMRENDEFTLSLLQNRELIDMLKNSHGARQFKREETDGKGEIIWTSTGENCKYNGGNLYFTDTSSQFPLPRVFFAIG
mgnify:CR=1 FL=1